MSTRRLAARSAIEKAIASVEDKSDLKAIKKAIDKAYPFGIRAYHPYRVWLDERREYFILLGIKLHPKAKPKPQKKKGVKHHVPPPGQLSLF